MVAVMQLIRGVINAVTVMIAAIVMVAVSSGFSKSTHKGPKRITPPLQDLPTPSEFTHHLHNLPTPSECTHPFRISPFLTIWPGPNHSFRRFEIFASHDRLKMIGVMLQFHFASAGGVLSPGDLRTAETHDRRFGEFWHSKNLLGIFLARPGTHGSHGPGPGPIGPYR